MNIKIQGGGKGTYANTGSCVAVTSYLCHEDIVHLKSGEKVETFFNDSRDRISAKEVTYSIDNNKAKLCKTDSKFFVLIVSPSSDELSHLGKTKEEQANAMRKYIRQSVMKNYAEGFGKGLTEKDIMYFAKIHYERHGHNQNDMHVHVIISRKDKSNKKKLSPKTNHTGNKKTGTVSGGFDRNAFCERCEQSFDKTTGFIRKAEESFKYQNTMKHGSFQEIENVVKWAAQVNQLQEEGLNKSSSLDLNPSLEEDDYSLGR